jgi:hypothetical protein
MAKSSSQSCILKTDDIQNGLFLKYKGSTWQPTISRDECNAFFFFLINHAHQDLNSSCLYAPEPGERHLGHVWHGSASP